jgi:hypothetical protein
LRKSNGLGGWRRSLGIWERESEPWRFIARAKGDNVKVYLDVCCFNRPFDDQSQDRIRLETEAVLLIIDKVSKGKWVLVSSAAIEVELKNIADKYRQKMLRDFTMDIYSEHVKYTPQIIKRAKALAELGFKKMDALHLACAEDAKVDIFLSTDDRLLKNAVRNVLILKVVVDNPLTWLRKQE